MDNSEDFRYEAKPLLRYLGFHDHGARQLHAEAPFYVLKLS
jgi:hypothetical protein